MTARWVWPGAGDNCTCCGIWSAGLAYWLLDFSLQGGGGRGGRRSPSLWRLIDYFWDLLEIKGASFPFLRPVPISSLDPKASVQDRWRMKQLLDEVVSWGCQGMVKSQGMCPLAWCMHAGLGAAV